MLMHFHISVRRAEPEVGGNHTDHNNGKVLAAAVNLDVIAAVKKTENGVTA